MRPVKERQRLQSPAQGAQFSPPQPLEGGHRGGSHAPDQAQGAQGQGTGQQEVEEAPQGGGGGPPSAGHEGPLILC